MADTESANREAELHPGAYHPAAFYVPSAKTYQTLDSSVEQQPDHPQVPYGDKTQNMVALLLVLVCLLLLLDWLWRNRH